MQKLWPTRSTASRATRTVNEFARRTMPRRAATRRKTRRSCLQRPLPRRQRASRTGSANHPAETHELRTHLLLAPRWPQLTTHVPTALLVVLAALGDNSVEGLVAEAAAAAPAGGITRTTACRGSVATITTRAITQTGENATSSRSLHQTLTLLRLNPKPKPNQTVFLSLSSQHFPRVLSASPAASPVSRLMPLRVSRSLLKTRLVCFNCRNRTCSPRRSTSRRITHTLLFTCMCTRMRTFRPPVQVRQCVRSRTRPPMALLSASRRS